MLKYKNPVIPGFYPDPSVCRVGDDYYLVNSSFEFFPGVPLWHSRDLLRWEQIGYVLNRPSQLPLGNAGISGGIYAPTIRYHNGKFYMITTNVSDGGNFIVTTDDIRGEWSEPVWVDQGGIDPSIFWDDDGRVYTLGTFSDEDDRLCIGQCEIDPETGRRLSERKCIWHGTGDLYPEGPHMYKIGDWYYLMIAEGGTEYGHTETIARSRCIWGPFEGCPHNPILSNRKVARWGDNIQGVGHADLIEDANGAWWLIFHGFRPSNCMLHHTGRETMLAPVVWDEDGWPVVNGGKPITPTMEIAGEGSYAFQNTWREEFSGTAPSLRWSYIRNPDFSRYETTEGGLVLQGCETTLDDMGSPTFLGVRQQQFELCYETRMRHLTGTGSAGITIFHTNEHHYDLHVEKHGNGLNVWLGRRAADLRTEGDAVFFADTDTLTLRITAERNRYVFSAGADEKHLTVIGTGSTQMISTEVMRGTFTGCFAGLFAIGCVEAEFSFFAVTEK